MNSKANKLKLYLPIALAAIFITATLRCIACLINLNYKTGYFEEKILINIAGYLTVGFCILFLTYPFVTERGKKLVAQFASPQAYVPTGLVAVSLVFLSFNLLISSAAKGGSSISSALAVVLGLLGLVSIGYFVLNAFITSPPSSIRAAFGICTVAFLALYAAFLYFDTAAPLNAPNKIVDQMAFLLSALFFLYETRISLCRGKWSLYSTFGMIAATLCAYSSIPSLITYIVKGNTISNSVYESLFIFTAFIFITSRLIMSLGYNEDREHECVTLMRAHIEKRQEEIDENESVRKQAYLEMLGKLSADEEEFEEEIYEEISIPEEAYPEELEGESDITENYD